MPTAPGGSRTRPPRCRCGCSDPLQGLEVVDLCAAPGGKTAQLASAGALATAIDRSTRRLDRLVVNLNRLGLAVRRSRRRADLAAGAPVPTRCCSMRRAPRLARSGAIPMCRI
jgi:hypothetical protein